jgi:3-hydroxybutyryl-CoA dehydrogenase
VADADIIIEAVPERPELKRDVLARAESAASAGSLLATNTSSLSIGELQQSLQRPDRFLGLHFFNPVHVNRLLEVVRGPATSDDTVRRGLDIAGRIGKEAVLVNDSPGFATSRLGVLLGLEAMRMVEEGVADAEAIDRAMELGYRHPMGPLKLTDLVGLDVQARHCALPPREARRRAVPSAAHPGGHGPQRAGSAARAATASTTGSED